MKKERAFLRIISTILVVSIVLTTKGITSYASTGSVATAGTMDTIKKIYEDRNHGAPTGYGWAAEHANNIYDRIRGVNTKVVGGDNAKNGADRRIIGSDGTIINIQDKYYKSATDTVEAAFDKDSGMYRYVNEDGSPMQLEVPKDQYKIAVESMEDKISEGKVPGITDPSEAKNIVREGKVTFEQAKNIAKAGNIDSLKYDAANGVIVAKNAMGIAFVLDFILCRMNGKSNTEAIKESSMCGLKTGGSVFAIHVLSNQIAKTGIKNALVPTSDAIANALGKDVASSILTTCGENVAGLSKAQLASKVSKIIQGQIIVDAVIVVVLSSKDVLDLMVGRISSKQLLSNLAVTLSTVAAGTAGYYIGGAIGGAIAPGVGIPIGAMGGSLILGAAGGYISGKIASAIYKGDADEMYDIIQSKFEEMSFDYLISKSEGDILCDKLHDMLTEKMTKDMYASEDREGFAEELMRPLFEEQVSERENMELPELEQIRAELLDNYKGIVFIH